MRIDVVRFDELAEAQIARWREIQATDVELGSPYFCPEFIQAVATVREDVRVAILQEGETIAGFFAFQRGKNGIGTAAGGKFSDFHGVLAAPGTAWRADELLRACGLCAWDFHHLPSSQRPFEPYFENRAESLLIDLTGGFDAYVAMLKQRKSKVIKDVAYNTRKLEEEVGPVRFEPHVEDPAALATLIEWKSRQYRESGLVDAFEFGWTRDLLGVLHGMKTPHFRGLLSGLRAGGEWTALHMGMLSATALNWWFPRHDERFGKRSPGILLLWNAAEYAAGQGAVRLDMGWGTGDSYKERFATGATGVASGSAEVPSFATWRRRAVKRLEAAVKASPLLPLVRRPGKWIAAAMRKARFK
jgi:CelD/BcsL family acetyltransferase involved in cellulose biosynthesis